MLLSGRAAAEECVRPPGPAPRLVPLGQRGEGGGHQHRRRPAAGRGLCALSAGLEGCAGPPPTNEEELQPIGEQSRTGKRMTFVV